MAEMNGDSWGPAKNRIPDWVSPDMDRKEAHSRVQSRWNMYIICLYILYYKGNFSTATLHDNLHVP